MAVPDIRLTGVDYSPRSSGLHSEVFDDRVYLPSWGELDSAMWLEQLMTLAGPDGVYIPSLDLEVELLATLDPISERVLSLPPSAIALCGKPPVAAGYAFELATPAALHNPDRDALEEFLHRHDYDVWVKGPNYEAERVHDVNEALRQARLLQTRWGRGWHVEEHAVGQEMAVTFAARQGQLLGAAVMTKLDTTDNGKTWAGAVRPASDALTEKLAAFVSMSGWHGGGELEMITTWHGQQLLLEVNPRFPAWIHGASLCGINLPALAVGCPPRSQRSASAFVRVVHEIAQRPELPLAAQHWKPDDNGIASGKHPSGMPLLSRRGRSSPPSHSDSSDWYSFSPAFTESLAALTDTSAPTPARYLDLGLVERQIQRLQDALLPAGPTRIALSIKTNPDPRLIDLAHRRGLWADAITGDEYAFAVEAGMHRSGLVLNGPAKWWPRSNDYVCAATFADSVAELRFLRDELRSGNIRLRTEVIGIRVTTSTLGSRFGENLEDGDSLAEAVSLLDELCRTLDCDWGVSFHHAQASLGTQRWVESAEAALEVGAYFADRLGSTPAIVDLGGGWRAKDVQPYGTAVAELRRRLLHVVDAETVMLVEPGRMLVEEAGTVITTVLLRRDDGRVVVDTSIAELPEAPAWPHPAAVWDATAQNWRPIGPGSQTIVGRSCMEEDVVVEGLDLAHVTVGTRIAIGRAGGYDASMAYAFGRGRSS